jgi:hypothetical protein
MWLGTTTKLLEGAEQIRSSADSYGRELASDLWETSETVDYARRSTHSCDSSQSCSAVSGSVAAGAASAIWQSAR